MAASDASPVPIYGQAFRIYFALRTTSGGFNSGAAGLVSKISKDGNTFIACNGNATEIAASSGIYYLDLTATEMTCSNVSLTISSSTTGAVPKEMFLYPQQVTDIAVDIQSINGSAVAADNQKSLLVNAIVKLSVDASTSTPTATDFETSSTVSRPDDFFKGRAVVFADNNLIGQASRIVGSTFTANGKIKLTVTALTSAPATNSTLFIL